MKIATGKITLCLLCLLTPGAFAAEPVSTAWLTNPNISANQPLARVQPEVHAVNVRARHVEIQSAGGLRAAAGQGIAGAETGLAPGLVTLTLVDRGARGGPAGLTLLRIERDGADLQAGLRVEAGQQIAGVRLIAAYGNSSVRGVVRVEGGALPPQLRLTVSARRVDASASVRDRGGRNVPVDASGRFQLDQLVAGTYELMLQAPGLSRNTIAPLTVSVGSGAVQNVTFPLNLAALTAQPPRGNGGQPRRIR